MGITSVIYRSSALFCVLVLLIAAGCGSTPSSPTPPPPPPVPIPVPDPPTLSCPSPITASTTAPAGTTVSFETPAASNGQTPVTVACAPPSGTTFAIGATTVTCTATDSLNRSASCNFPVTVSRTPQLTLLKFLAFGDSVTAGEVSFASGGITPQGVPSTRMVLIPSSSYPSVLRNLMTARYTAQANNIVMLNEGKSGEKVRDSASLTRFANAVANNRPDVVLLMHGYNDIENSGVITDSVNAVDAMMAEARNRRVGRVFALNLAPGRPGRSNSRPDSSIRAFNERLERAARGENAVYVDIYSALLPDVNVNIGSDGLHPTEAGYRKIAETVLAAVRANLEVR